MKTTRIHASGAEALERARMLAARGHVLPPAVLKIAYGIPLDRLQRLLDVFTATSVGAEVPVANRVLAASGVNQKGRIQARMVDPKVEALCSRIRASAPRSPLGRFANDRDLSCIRSNVHYDRERGCWVFNHRTPTEIRAERAQRGVR